MSLRLAANLSTLQRPRREAFDMDVESVEPWPAVALDLVALLRRDGHFAHRARGTDARTAPHAHRSSGRKFSLFDERPHFGTESTFAEHLVREGDGASQPAT